MWKKSDKSVKKPRITYIPGWRNIRWMVYPENKYDTCGYTAACMLLYYYHKEPGVLFERVIPPEFFGKDGKLLTTGYTLQDKLIQYASVNRSWGWSVAKVLNCYFEEYHIPAKAHFGLFRLGAYKRVKNGAPVILFGNLPRHKEDLSDIKNRLNHAVLAYGLNQTDSRIPRFIVHYGWKNRAYNVLNNALIGSFCYITTN
jgi:hypothetical protein